MGKLGKGKAKERLVSDTDLFAIDDAGNEQLRAQLLSGTHDAPAAAHPRRGSGKPLKSTEILAMRSKVPARTSKVQPGVMVQHMKEREKRMKVTPELKKRLRSMVKHANASDRGLWDATSHNDRAALQLPSAVAGSGSQDLWDTQANAVASTSKAIVPAAVEEMSLSKPAVKMPRTLRSHGLLDSAAPSAIALPHPGESYNPTLNDHQRLLAQQHAEAEAEEAAKQAARAVKDTITSNAKGGSTWDTGYAEEVGSGDEMDEVTEAADESMPLKKAPRRKTDKMKARRKENKLLEARTKAQSKITKSQRQALGTLKDIANDLEGSTAVSLADLHKRKAALAKRISTQGIAGMRSGPGRAPKIRQNFLLSDELPESLRQLKADGDLWQDWLDSSRRRGRVQTERGTFGRMMKAKGRNLKSVEKATWRNFDRD